MLYATSTLCFCLLAHFARGFSYFPTILIPSVVFAAELDGEEEIIYVGEGKHHGSHFLHQAVDIFDHEAGPGEHVSGQVKQKKKEDEKEEFDGSVHFVSEPPREIDDRIVDKYQYAFTQSEKDEDQFSLSWWNDDAGTHSVDLHRKRWMSETRIMVGGDLKVPEPVFFELESQRGVGSCRLKIKSSQDLNLNDDAAELNLALEFLHCTYIRDEEPVTIELVENLVVISSSVHHKESLRQLKKAIGGKRQLDGTTSGVIGNCVKNGGRVPCPSLWSDCWNTKLKEGTYERVRIFIATDRGYCDRFKTQTECGEDAIGVIDDANTIYRSQLGVDLFPSIVFTDPFGSLDMRPEVAGTRSCSVKSVQARLAMMRTYRMSNYFYRNAKDSNVSKAQKKALANDDFGIFHLLTDCYPPSGIVGMAYTRQLCNSNAVSLSTYTETRWLTFAHEVGHNFGSRDAFTTPEEEGKVGGIMDYGDGTYYDPERKRTMFQFHPKHQEQMCEYMRSRKAAETDDVTTRCFESTSDINSYPAPKPKPIEPSAQGLFIAKIILICITIIGTGSAFFYAIYLIYRRYFFGRSEDDSMSDLGTCDGADGKSKDFGCTVSKWRTKPVFRHAYGGASHIKNAPRIPPASFTRSATLESLNAAEISTTFAPPESMLQRQQTFDLSSERPVLRAAAPHRHRNLPRSGSSTLSHRAAHVPHDHSQQQHHPHQGRRGESALNQHGHAGVLQQQRKPRRGNSSGGGSSGSSHSANNYLCSVGGHRTGSPPHGNMNRGVSHPPSSYPSKLSRGATAKLRGAPLGNTGGPAEPSMPFIPSGPLYSLQE